MIVDCRYNRHLGLPFRDSTGCSELRSVSSFGTLRLADTGRHSRHVWITSQSCCAARQSANGDERKGNHGTRIIENKQLKYAGK